MHISDMLDRLRTFLEVYRRRSMGRAAEALSLTQPAVSQQIAALERVFGAPLFERSRAGVTPTVVADSLAKDVAEALDALEMSIAGRLARQPRLSGVIHLGAPPELFSVLGPRIVSGLSDTDLQVVVHLGGQSFLHNGLDDGSIDLALLASKAPGRSYLSIRLGTEKLGLYAHPALVEHSRGRTIDLAFLNSSPFVAYDQELSLIRQFAQHAFQGRVSGKPAAIIPDLRSLAAATTERPVWTVLPDYLAGSWEKSGTLARLLPGMEVSNALYLVLQRSALRTPRTAFAKDVVESICSST